MTVGGNEVRRLHSSDHFGEIALITEGPRTATVTAETELKCYGLTPWEFRGRSFQTNALDRLEDPAGAREASRTASLDRVTRPLTAAPYAQGRKENSMAESQSHAAGQSYAVHESMKLHPGLDLGLRHTADSFEDASEFAARVPGRARPEPRRACQRARDRAAWA